MFQPKDGRSMSKEGRTIEELLVLFVPVGGGLGGG